jgi:hypothetical protein
MQADAIRDLIDAWQHGDLSSVVVLRALASEVERRALATVAEVGALARVAEVRALADDLEAGDARKADCYLGVIAEVVETLRLKLEPDEEEGRGRKPKEGEPGWSTASDAPPGVEG